MTPLKTLPIRIAVLLAIGLILAVPGHAAVPAATSGETDVSWPAPVAGFVAPQPGEHPRLLFRKADLPALRERAKTPEGQAILNRLRFLLNGSDGESMPTVFNTNKPVNVGAKGAKELPPGTFTIGHAAGFGFLYQLTGDKKYADLSRQCFEKEFAGQPDRDERYCFTTPGAALRVGMLILTASMAYDFCYEGWDADFRATVAKELIGYSHKPVDFGPFNEGGKGPVTMEMMALSPRMPPTSNHFGNFVAAAGIACYAVKGDPGIDEARVEKYLAGVEKQARRELTEGFGDHGLYAEGPGPSHMSANPAFIPFLQIAKVAGGKDWISPRPNAQWLTMRWVMETVPRGGVPYYPCRHPSTYGTELVARDGTSDGGEYCQGFGAVTDEQKPALLWVYHHFVEPGEDKANGPWLKPGEKSYDAMVYPHRAVLSYINWPVGVAEKDPAEVIGRTAADTLKGYYDFRNRWQDEDDTLVTAFPDPTGTHGYVRSDHGGPVIVWGLGVHTQLPGSFHNATVVSYETRPDGSGVLALINGGTTPASIAVDFGKTSGADALIVEVGQKPDGPPRKAAKDPKPSAEPKGNRGATAHTTIVTAGGIEFTIMTLQAGSTPEVKTEGDTVLVGEQVITFDGHKIIVAK